MLRLAEKLRPYDKAMSSLPPLALMTFAAPLGLASETPVSPALFELKPGPSLTASDLFLTRFVEC